MRIVAFLIAVFALGCAEHKIVLPAADPGQVLVDKLETRLMRAKSVHIEADVVTDASTTTNIRLHESLFLGAGQRARVEVAGVVGDDRVASFLVCDGNQLVVLGHAPIKVPTELRDALVIDFVRRGLSPNALAIVDGRAPPYANGGVRDAFHLEREHAGDPATEIRFDVVSGKEQNAVVVGEAHLSLDTEEKPRTRRSGDVVERYSVVELDAPMDDAIFALPK